jgi:hypothetical protein
VCILGIVVPSLTSWLSVCVLDSHQVELDESRLVRGDGRLRLGRRAPATTVCDGA